jgi:quinol monooxygenase YgiN
MTKTGGWLVIKPLTIVAKIQSLPGFEVEVEKALIEAIKPTLVEKGCLQYDLHRDLGKPGLFLYYENWASREEWDTHMGSEHLGVMKAATEGKIEDVVIYEMTRIGL